MRTRLPTAYRLLRTGYTHASEVICSDGTAFMPYLSAAGRVNTLRVPVIDYLKARVAVRQRRSGLGPRRRWWR